MDNNLNLLLEFLREARGEFSDYLTEDDYYHEDDDQDYDEGYADYRDEELERANQQVDRIIDEAAATGVLSKDSARTIQNFIEDNADVLTNYLRDAGEDEEVEDQILAYIEGVFK